MKKCLKLFLRGKLSQFKPFREIIYKVCKKDILNKHLVIKMRTEDYLLLVNTKDNWSKNPITWGRVETPEDKFIKKIIKKGDIIFDVGAHWGGFTVLFGKLVGKTGKVYSFEPSSINFRYLKKNICINNLKNIISIYKYAVGNKEKFIKLAIAESSSGHNSIVRGDISVKEYEEVKQISLDNFINTNGINKINFLKIDVEGYELEVLKGFEKSLKKLNNFWLFIEYSPIFMEKEKALELLDFLKYYFDDVYIGHNKKIFKTDWESVKSISFEKGQRNLFLYKN
ncbi:MAG: hypothetical protein DSY59_03385 [Persephonella sp.]|nr:MAG: hypothetical protein DSY60_05720 [Persephonella sp.]RUM60207.1 MAG: hypothetical protein DSY59_03385 [Persephonella sp.]